MTTQSQYAATPKVGIGQVTTAQATRDNPGSNIVDVMTGGTNGSRVDRIWIKALSTTTANVIRLYIHDGTNSRLWKEITVIPNTPAATASTWEAWVDAAGLLLPTSSYKLRATTNNTESYNVIAIGGDF